MKIKEFEEKIDNYISGLASLSAPVHIHLATLYNVISIQMNGSRRNSRPPRREEGEHLCSRLSYLFPLLVQQTELPVTEITMGEVQDAMNHIFSLYQDPTIFAKENRDLLSYAHFCEIMPKVHRGYFVERVESDFHLILDYKTESFRKTEALDISIGELSLPYIEEKPVCSSSEFEPLLYEEVPLSVQGAYSTLGRIYDHYKTNVTEPPILTKSGFMEALGCTKEEFHKVQAAIHAISDFYICLYQLLDLKVEDSDSESELHRLGEEMLKKAFILLEKSFLFEFISGSTNIAKDVVSRIMKPFSIDLSNETVDFRFSKDGFFPPFLLTANEIFFSPHVAKLMFHTRNIVFFYNASEPDYFSKEISEHLEPALISTAVELFDLIPDLIIKPNVRWKKSEIDLLVYYEPENIALHIQAKAAIPPQGPRMTRALEVRLQEGIDQLEKFRKLSQANKDRIISQAVDQKVESVQVIDVILSRMYFGTERIMEKFDDIAILNLGLLALLVTEFENSPSLRNLPSYIQDKIKDFMNHTSPTWEYGSLTIDDKTIEIPLLDLDYKKINIFKDQLWKSVLTEKPTLLAPTT